MPWSTIPLEIRFWHHVNKTDTCWIWIGNRHKKGYGCIQIGKQVVGAHRVSYKLAGGVIPKGLCVLHRCDNPPCVNPDHLFLGTNADNNRDRANKDRSKRFRGAEVAEIKREAESASVKALAIRHGVSVSTIRRAIERATENGD